MKTLFGILAIVTTLTGCANGSKAGSVDQGTSSSSRKLVDGPTESKTPVSPDEVIEFRGGTSKTNTTDYTATDATYRVYGTDGAAATIAELGTWVTRQYRVGDDFGRGYLVSKVEADAVTLHGAQADVRMPVGVNTKLRVIQHNLDVVALPLGNHHWQLRTAAARAALDTNPARPALAAQKLYDQAMEQLGDVPANGLWAGADFQPGDLIATIDGQPAGPDVLDAIETGLTDGRPKLEVTIYRGGVPFNRTYATLLQ
jgi:hypothetical protein